MRLPCLEVEDEVEVGTDFRRGASCGRPPLLCLLWCRGLLVLVVVPVVADVLL